MEQERKVSTSVIWTILLIRYHSMGALDKGVRIIKVALYIIILHNLDQGHDLYNHIHIQEIRTCAILTNVILLHTTFITFYVLGHFTLTYALTF